MAMTAVRPLPLLAAMLIIALQPRSNATTQLPPGGVAAIEQQFRTPPDASRIMMRWWWFGPSMTREQADSEMRRMKEGGIGGFEIATVYPMAVDDPARGIRNYPYLSSEYLDLVAFTSRRARELGLRMDVTLGSGWSFGGPHITPDLAAKRLRSDRREIAPHVTSVARPQPYEDDRLIAAFVGRGSTREVDPDSFRELDVSGNGPIAVPAGSGPRTLLFFFSGRTGQVVKRAALGADGYVLDHYSRPAIEKHLREVGDKLVAAAGRGGGIHAIFCDSLEVYEADWTDDMLVEFRRRRGYDLRPLLPMLEYQSGDRSRLVRHDFGRTLTELYEERFLVPIREWSRRNNVLFRIQGYGAPPASLSSYRYADLFDGEGFEWRTLSRARWASSAAHLLNNPVAASETWTWIHSPAFRATPFDIKAEADQHFLSGINQLIGHGWPSTPPQAGAPGWPFYAAGAFTDRNPWWPVMPDLAAYLHRLSFLMRQGEPVADLALYAPTEDARAEMRPGTAAYLNLWSGVRDRIPESVIPAILDNGYSFDAIDDGTLAEARARGYKAVLLPVVKSLPDATKRWLDDFVRSGGKVIHVDASLAQTLKAAVTPDVTLTPATADLGFVHRRLADADIYFLANTGNRRQRVGARFRSAASHVEMWDPMTGKVERVDASRGELTLEFEPYSSHVVVFRASAGAAPMKNGAAVTVASDALQSGWNVTIGATSAGSTRMPHSWAEDPNTRYFSGTTTYRRTWEAPRDFHAEGARVYLDFGPAAPIEREPLPDGTIRGNSFAALVAPPIREAATVFVNDRRVGTIWAPPYRIDITSYLHSGPNDVRLDVYNTAINQLAEGGRLPDVTALADRFGQRFRLQDMDGLQPLPSGVLGVPRVVAER